MFRSCIYQKWWWYTYRFHITECSWSKLAGGKWYLRVNSIWRPYLKMIDHLILFWQRFLPQQTSVIETPIQRCGSQIVEDVFCICQSYSEGCWCHLQRSYKGSTQYHVIVLRKILPKGFCKCSILFILTGKYLEIPNKMYIFAQANIMKTNACLLPVYKKYSGNAWR